MIHYSDITKGFQQTERLTHSRGFSITLYLSSEIRSCKCFNPPFSRDETSKRTNLLRLSEIDTLNKVIEPAI